MQNDSLFSLFGLAEGTLRVSIFLAAFAVMALAEWMLPKRERVQPKGRRWLTNWGIVILDSILTRLIMPILPIGVALYASAHQWGLFNWLAVPNWLGLIVGFLLLDFAIWLQHLLSHVVPIFWRLHKVHHVDRDIDVSTALRFHPIEILLSLVYKIVWVLVFGMPAIAVFVFEVVLNAAALFNHANVNLPERVDKILRLVIVTPDMHRVHHSDVPRETHSNYGFNLSIWDRVFGTYVAQPEKGHLGMTVGLSPYQDEKPAQFVWSLLLPFRKRRAAPSKG
ncbi:sterol desaturase family protein [uncultured Cohaesibacter sp.]|uniref:sterol desaturase family protein n=1 Tax=uncultured Cohaesibacter sp. TaxID=1002546 RepID=UPI00292CD4C1|nr:sterol desaturase family protein [uncultured Cohaesibacter sp.]